MTEGSLKTEFMGIETSIPIFISPAAMAKLGHPDGEVNLTKGAGEMGIVQGVSLSHCYPLEMKKLIQYRSLSTHLVD